MSPSPVHSTVAAMPRRPGVRFTTPRAVGLCLILVMATLAFAPPPRAAATELMWGQANPNTIAVFRNSCGNLEYTFHFGGLSNDGQAVHVGSVDIYNRSGVTATVDATIMNARPGPVGKRSLGATPIGSGQRFTWIVQTAFWPWFGMESHHLGSCDNQYDQVMFKAPTRRTCQSTTSPYRWAQNVCLYVNSDNHDPAIFVTTVLGTGAGFNRGNVTRAVLVVRLHDTRGGIADYTVDITSDVQAGRSHTYKHTFASGAKGHVYYAEGWARITTHTAVYDSSPCCGQHPTTGQLLR